MCLDCDTAHRSDGFVECRENPRLAERRHDAVPVHVGPKVRAEAREDHADPLARQTIEQIANGLRSGVVHIRDRAGTDDEPADRRRRALHEGAHFVGQEVIVRVKQIRLEAIDHEPGSVSLPGVAGTGVHRPDESGANIIVCGR